MIRVLFVDDEPAVLEGLENGLRRQRKRWQMEFVTRAREAIERMEQNAYDVLITDMRMPEMDGNQLLEWARLNQPEVVRILLTGHAEKQQLLRALPAAHRILLKPCEADTLEEAIDHGHHLRREITDPEVESVVGGLDALPIPPEVHSTLLTLLEDPDVTSEQIADAVRHDVFATARILQVGNAAASGGDIATVDAAIGCLGIEALRGLVLSHGLFDAMEPGLLFDGFSVETLDRRSVLASRLARRLLDDPAQQAIAQSAGLLHDLGQFVMAVYLPGRFRQARNLARVSDIALPEAERRTFGTTHAEIAAFLLGRWNLPAKVVEAVRNHHQPGRVSRTEFGAAGAVHVAAALAERIVGGSFGPKDGMPLKPEPLDVEYLEAAGVAANIEQWEWAAVELADAALPGVVS
ncbi:MAG: HDOD domain-containing protein [Gemmatimonadota bacterium]